MRKKKGELVRKEEKNDWKEIGQNLIRGPNRKKGQSFHLSLRVLNSLPSKRKVILRTQSDNGNKRERGCLKLTKQL